jgi:hypothetical protein
MKIIYLFKKAYTSEIKTRLPARPYKVLTSGRGFKDHALGHKNL